MWRTPYSEDMTKYNFTPSQLLFKELFVGTLIYAVVLGFMNDYTNLVDVVSFSTTFMAAFVLELLTYAVFFVKKRIVAWLTGRDGMAYKVLMFFMVWLVMFLSKFVFIWAIDWVFGDAITIDGFVGILVVAVVVTLVHKVADFVFVRLGSMSR